MGIQTFLIMRFKQWLKKWFSRKKSPVVARRIKALVADAQPTATQATVRITTGVKHNNPLNVKAFRKGKPVPDYWNGQNGVDSRGHAIFDISAYGIRAGIVLLRTYESKYKLSSIASILSRYAPSTDTIGSLPGAPPNSPEEYTRFVARETGLDPIKPLRIFADGKVKAPEKLFAVLSAMTIFENGHGYKLSRDDFDKALTPV